MLHLRQPTDTTCGQTCVAMLAGVKVWQAIEVIGHGRSTRIGDLHRALAVFGVKCNDWLMRASQKTHLPERAILKYTLGRPAQRKGHWVVLHAGWIYDPSANAPYKLPSWFPQYACMFNNADCRVTSFAKVFTPDGQNGLY